MPYQTPAEIAMIKARIALLHPYGYLAQLSLQLRLQETPGLGFATATDGTYLKYDPELILRDRPEWLETRIAKAALSCGWLQPWRRGNRDPAWWSAACELAATAILAADGFKLPPDMLHDPQFVSHSAEQVFDKIYPGSRPQETTTYPEGPPGSTGHDGVGEGVDEDGDEDADDDDDADEDADDDVGGAGGEDVDEDVDDVGGDDDQQDSTQQGGEEDDDDEPGLKTSASAPRAPRAGNAVQDAPKSDPSPQGSGEDSETRTERDWQIAVLEAEMFASRRGDSPGAAQQLVDALRRSKVRWEDLLRQFVQCNSKSDYDWMKPHPAYLPAGIYLPMLNAPKMGKIVLFCDASASTWSILPRFANEMQTILEDLEPEQLAVVYWDVEFKGRENFEYGDTLKLHAKGAGGTNFSGCWHWLEQQDDLQDVACIVFLTDADAVFASTEPLIPLLWAVTGIRTPPYGEVVRIDPDDRS